MGRFVTTIFNATQHYSIVATLFRMVATLFNTATLCCDENRRCKSSLCNIILIDPGHASIAFPRNRELIQGG